MKGFRKFLSVMLVCSMLAVPPMQGVNAAEYGNGSVEASAEICAEMEESGTETGNGTQGQEESETEDTESKEVGGEKETGETTPEDGGAETGKPANPGEMQDDDGDVSGTEEDSAGETGAEDADEGTEKTEEDGQQEEAVADVLPEQGESAAAETFAAEGGETSGSCGANVTWRFEDGVLTISGSGAMEDFNCFSAERTPWYEYRENINRAVIEDGVKSVGVHAFYECDSLTSIEISSGVTAIGGSAFYGCSSLTSIKIPSGVTTISNSVFYGCSSLTSIEIPSGVTSIESGAFRICSNLTSIEIPSGVTSIEAYVFDGCRSLTNIKIPSRATLIKDFAFSDCSSLKAIEIPSGVTSIGWGAFSGCNSLTSIELPPGLKTIGSCAFENCSSLTGIEIPLGITAIESGTFNGCSSLTSIAIPSGVTTIGYQAFMNCSSLTGIAIPSEVVSIGNRAFGDCSSLINIEIPSGVTTIEGNTFNGCSGLKSIAIPSEVVTIESCAFDGCSRLKDVYYGGNESDWRAITIEGWNEPLTSAAIHYNSSGLGSGDTPKPPVNPESDPTLIVKSRSFAFTDPQTVHLVWGWNYILNRSSTEYIHDVSTAALALSAAAERSKSDIESMLAGEHFGADFITSKNYNTDTSEEINNPACTFAHKAINNGGKIEHIIIIVGRGTSTDADLITDAISLGDHFSEPASNVWRSFLGWLETNGLDNKINSSNTKFFVTGHSLGGAVANRIAYRLTRDYGGENVYAYTFGTPPTEGQTSTCAPNIFNVLYDWDPVPFLGIFTDGRYGVECWFTDGDRGRFPSKHLVQSYMKRLLNGADKHFKGSQKSGGAWCPVDLKIYNSSGNLVGSVTDNIVDEENVTDSVLIVLSGENKDQKNFYFFDDDTYDIKLLGKDNGTLTYTIRDTSADKQTITERVYANVALTPGKRMTSSVSVWDKSDPDISAEDKIDTLQVPLFVLDENDNIVREVLPDGSGTEIPYTDPGEVLPGDIPADGKIPDGLWIAGVEESYTYTGAAIKPEIRVYDGKKKLQPGKDYTASYKNNTKANDAANSSKAPAVVVRGKGNYAGTETATFKITAVALSDDSISVEDMVTAYNKKVQKKTPVLTYNGRKLAKNRDFTVSYPNGNPGAYKEAGVYEILLTAKAGGNFSGTRTVSCTITESTLLGKVSVKKIPNQAYTGKAIEPELTVTYKNKPLIKGTDYTVSYTDHIQIGTAKAVLTGIGKYAGTKKVSFRITGTSLKGVAVSGIENKVYNGDYQKQDMTVTLKGRALAAGTDYEAVYATNREAGKASVTIRGKGAYTGTIKKTFRIGKFDIAANKDGRLTAEVKQKTIPYAKGGAKPEVTVRFRTGDGGWRTLSEGKDYTLSYRNYAAVNDGSRADKLPAVTVKGKGNFSGTYGTAIGFQIAAQELGRLTPTAQDRTYQNKKNSYSTKFSITDLNGKVLKAGTDYQKTFTYLYKKETEVCRAGGEKVTQAAGTVVDKEDIIPAGTVLIVRAEAKEGGNYTGTLEGEYRITKASISSASVSVPKQVYTGKPIALEKNLLTVKMKGKQLDESQYEIVPGSYKNNVQKGTASVTLCGVDNYGGTKTVKFTIRAKGLLWWWR